MSHELPNGFRHIPRTGVIYVMTEAQRAGWHPKHPEWSNLGQGAPEAGALPGAPPRVQSINLTEAQYEYAPVGGLPALRDAVAELYNHRFRSGKRSKYTRDNVAISAGGRLALTRLVSTLGRVNIGHFLPDYTAYEELLGAFGTFVPIPVLLQASRDYAFTPSDLHAEIEGRGLSAMLLSNPCNPTGRLLHGSEMDSWLEVARSLDCTMVFDEFYSHYTYVGNAVATSAASAIDDVNRDPVVIIDGLTKNWRYPGWRVSWTVGPASIIEMVTSAGSFLDGGCPHPIQSAAVPLLAGPVADAEARAIRARFSKKRNYLLEQLHNLGVGVSPPPDGGFYCWGDLSALPAPLNRGNGLFRAALEQQVIIVPGSFFDINPGRRRPERAGRFDHYARFSFGPDLATLQRGLASLRRVIDQHS